MTGNTRKQLSSNFATIGHTFPSLWIGLVAVLIFAGANPASAIVAVDQQTVSNQFNSGLRVQTFVPVGQTFIPTVSWHVGVELLLSMSCSSPALPPWDRAFKLRSGSMSEYGAYVKSRRGPAAGQKAAMYPFLVYPSSPAALARRALDREGVVLQRVLIADA